MYLEFVNLAERRCSDGLSAVVEIQENVVDAHSEIKIFKTKVTVAPIYEKTELFGFQMKKMIGSMTGYHSKSGHNLIQVNHSK